MKNTSNLKSPFIRNEQVVGSIPTVSSNPYFFSFFSLLSPPCMKPSQTAQLKIKFQPHSLWGLHPIYYPMLL